MAVIGMQGSASLVDKALLKVLFLAIPADSVIMMNPNGGSAVFNGQVDVGGIHNGERAFSVNSDGHTTINTESTGSTKAFTVKTGASSDEAASIAANGDAVFMGNVGIGVTSMSHKLCVSDNIKWKRKRTATLSTGAVTPRWINISRRKYPPWRRKC